MSQLHAIVTGETCATATTAGCARLQAVREAISVAIVPAAAAMVPLSVALLHNGYQSWPCVMHAVRCAVGVTAAPVGQQQGRQQAAVALAGRRRQRRLARWPVG